LKHSAAGVDLPAKKNVALIVDDDSTLRYVLARLARRAGYEILEANGGAGALETAENKSPDVMVADIRLPDFDGFERCRKIKARASTKAIPVMLVTSMYYESAKNSASIAAGKKKAMDAGALDLWPRGEALEALGPMLEKLAKKKNGPSTKAK
jgi:CheY-like chemotaxis protein